MTRKASQQKVQSPREAQRFIFHLISLVRKEMKVDTKAMKKLLSGSSQALQKKGVAILNLKVTGKAKIVRNIVAGFRIFITMTFLFF